MPILHKKRKTPRPARLLVTGLAGLVLIGTLLLMLPISTRAGEVTRFTEALFTAASAACVTGITLFDTYTHWSGFGQAVILFLIQLGGIGLLTIVTMLNLMLGRRIGLLQAQELVAGFSTEGLPGLRRVFIRIIAYSFTMELAGALVLGFIFVPKHGAYGVFMAIFTAISAFCNAGFDLQGIVSPGVGFTPYADSPVVLTTIAALILLGGLGYIVWQNVLDLPKTKRLSIHTRVVLVTSAVLIFTGAAAYFAVIRSEPDLAAFPLGEQIGSAFFTSVSARTAGFSALPVAFHNDFGEIVTILLMFTGGAPGSTAGGIKVTTLALIAATVFSVVAGHEDTVLMGCRVRKDVIYKTLTVFSLSLLFTLSAFVVVYLRNEELGALEVLFETVSAFSTTGFTNGIANRVDDTSKYVMVATMFAGRIGPVSLMLSLFDGKRSAGRTVRPESTIMVG